MATTTKYGTTPAPELLQNAITQEQKSFGFGFPIGEVVGTKATGSMLRREAGTKLIRNNIKQLFATVPGERIMLPNFGLDLGLFLFEPLDEQTFENIKLKIISAITAYVPQVKILKLSVFSDQNVNAYGGSGFNIKLVLQLKEDMNNIFDTQIEVK